MDVKQQVSNYRPGVGFRFQTDRPANPGAALDWKLSLFSLAALGESTFGPFVHPFLVHFWSWPLVALVTPTVLGGSLGVRVSNCPSMRRGLRVVLGGFLFGPCCNLLEDKSVDRQVGEAVAEWHSPTAMNQN